ncbi:uncharacterized protein LOC115402249 [Salarias fasciatus]|uniref:uncharacterized protein LOC115402249 n=1 Tax=Salarias fasciatus TaxID=181472 RepID=UPI001176F426|nr:uncharacterized protein LOC115402249 [Salarias fasciatus]
MSGVTSVTDDPVSTRPTAHHISSRPALDLGLSPAGPAESLPSAAPSSQMPKPAFPHQLGALTQTAPEQRLSERQESPGRDGQQTDMFLIALMAAVLWSSSEVRGRVTVVQPAAVSAPVGGSVVLSCDVEPEVFDNIRMAWYYQQAGGGVPPRLLVLLARQRADGLPERIVTGGKNRRFHLNITDVQPEDAGVYYCQSYHYRDRQDLFPRREGAAQKPAAGSPTWNK